MSDKTWKTSRTFLVVSLAFNIFFVGTVVGGAVIGRSLHHKAEGIRRAPPIHSFVNPGRVLHEVNKADRRPLIKLIRKDMKKMHPLLKSVGQHRRDALTILGGKAFDEGAALETLKALAEAEAIAHAASDQTLVRLLASLPGEERQRIIENLKKRRHEGRRGRHSGQRRQGPGRPDPGQQDKEDVTEGPQEE